MQTQKGMDGKLKKAVDQGVLAHLPLTFLPFVNQQIAQWEYLFPNERRSVERLLLYVAELTPPNSDALFREVVQLENRMGVRNWQFSTSEQTILNSSQLARSPYFEDWRRAVQSVFDEVDRYAMQTDVTRAKPVHRLILIDLPRPLPVDAEHVWRPWGEIGRPLQLDPGLESGASSFFDFLIAGSRGLVVRVAAAGAKDAGGFAEHLPVGEDVDFVWRLAGRERRLRTHGPSKPEEVC